MMRRLSLLAACLAATLLVGAPAFADCVPSEFPDGWLLEQEHKGGHTVDRHVSKSEAWLIDRLKRDRKIPAASSFPDRVTARQVIGLALAPDENDLDEWARTARAGEVAEIRMAFEQPIGRIVVRGKAVGEPAFGLRLFVRALGDGNCFLLTAYPTHGG
ncbi:MAG: hypothetical protein HQ481_16195 [Alphaproteobacteria bacterium]|nr:hypothetical protein [Alphaproteobacteria bacterium]